MALVDTPLLGERLRKAALAVVRERTWEASLQRLANGYRSALLRAPAIRRGPQRRLSRAR